MLSPVSSSTPQPLLTVLLPLSYVLSLSLLHSSSYPMMVNFMCQLAWATTYTDVKLNVISGCVCEVFWMRLIFESAVWVKQIVFHMWVGIIWSAEGLSEMKAQVRKKKKKEKSLPDHLQAGTLVLSHLWTWTQNGIYTIIPFVPFIPAFLVFQLADCRSWVSQPS